jgi:hypothetical protein
VQFGEYSNTSLSQLAWIAPAVRHGQIFLATTEAGLLATSENSGGYRLFDVFGNTLAKILQREWDGEAGMRRAVLKASSLHYIPGLLWKTRLGRSGGFSTDGILESLSAYRPFISYWLLIVPIAKLPLSLALFFAIAAKVASLTFSIQRKVLAKLRLGRYARMHAVEY